ncbi:hypothetical protein LKF67_1440 [Lactococcus lactis subsp. lactis]|uniref:hypothetical protein n=1 Tax=Lactococcus lactis TaxID=1358 RepID=UPI00072AFE2D|nr:hypothetical protein [Lactococcus lactis]KST90141.1 hypothetical protein LKF67_1440 [Lactococcus lactis subsp. lactis]
MKVTIEGNSEEIKKLFNTSASSIEQKNMEIQELKRSLVTALSLIPPFNKGRSNNDN